MINEYALLRLLHLYFCRFMSQIRIVFVDEAKALNRTQCHNTQVLINYSSIILNIRYSMTIIDIMVVLVVKFSWEGYKIRYIFCLK